VKRMRVNALILVTCLGIAGCSERSLPTEPAEEPKLEGVTAKTSHWYATVGGPSVIGANGVYTWYAGTNVFSPSYVWYSRFCNTLSATACTGTFFQAGSYSSSYSRNMTRDCSAGGTRSFQLRVVVTGWYSAHETSPTHVFRLCPPVEP
jgi:hypothetical protein